MFPPEIFNEIFSYLTSEARVLVACSQAHLILAQLIEPILYAHVIIHNNDVDTEDEHHLKLKPYQLSTLLSDNPRILNHLRSLCVELSAIHNKGTEEIIAILPRLKLERIQLTFVHDTICAEWQWFHIAFRTAFLACISTSYMKEISLDAVSYLPLSSFADCAGLKRLTLCRHANPPLSNGSFNSPQLEALELSDWTMTGPFDYFFSWALKHASRLRSVTLRTPRSMGICKFLPRLLTICSTSLVNLTIHYTKTCKSIYPTPKIDSRYRTVLEESAPFEIDFPGLPSLDRLRLCTYSSSFTFPRSSDNKLVRYASVPIAQILQTLPSLKHLTLIVCLEFRGYHITGVDWSPLADFLSERLSSFQHADLDIRAMTAGGEVSFDEVNSLLSRCETLMNLVEAGYVSIKQDEYLDVDPNRIFWRYPSIS